MPFVVHQDAKMDLARIAQSDPDAYAELLLELEDLADDPLLRDKLLGRPFTDGDIDAKRWAAVWTEAHVDVRRVKWWDVETAHPGYRVIYYFHPPHQTFYVLAVVHKASFDYDDPQDPIRLRIYNRLTSDFGGGYGYRTPRRH